MFYVIFQFFLVCCSVLFSNTKEDYWQQYVNYEMKITLLDSIRQVAGTSTIRYTNNSPDSLDRIYMHLYPNAFQLGSVKYREYLGNYGRKSRARTIKESIESSPSKIEIHDLSISVPKEGLSWIHKKSILKTYNIEDTILELLLSDKIAPGQTTKIDLDWTHHVGEMLERAGYYKGQYNMAQWYPKIAVYDQTGWNSDVFHAEGEFYGEFGDFQVNFSLPKSFVIGATGTVLDGDPGWADVQVDTTLDFSIWKDIFDSTYTIADEIDSRSVTFTAENVHDFAWVASKNFFYEGGMSRDSETNIHVLYDRDRGHDWTKVVLERSIDALDWLESSFGKYPYPQITTTDRVKNGGMEYPMLVMNGREDESLIAHEFGHVYFYGILANNEVNEPWLDEGFTTYQTTEYMTKKYGAHGYDPSLYDGYDKFPKKKFPKQSELFSDQWSAIKFQISGHDENISRPSHLFNSTRSYSQNAYTKPALMLFELKYILEDSLFSEVMKKYYSKWKFKHTNELRFINVVEDVVQEDMSWFFDPWLHTTHRLDYSIESFKKKYQKEGLWKIDLKIKNKGSRFLPIKVRAFHENGYEDFWWTNHSYRYDDIFSFSTTYSPIKVVLDPDVQTLDLDFRNNTTKMENKIIFNWPGLYYNPRDEYVYKWNPNFYYHKPSNDFSPGLSLSKTYGPYEKSFLSINYSTIINKAFWHIQSSRQPVHFFPRTKFKIWGYNKPGIKEYGAEIEKKWNLSYGRTPTQTFLIGIYHQPRYVQNEREFLRIDTSKKLAASYFTTSTSIGVFKLKLKTVSSLGFFSDWNFSKTEFESKASVSWKIGKNKSDVYKIPEFDLKFKNRIVVGKVLGNAPRHELFKIEGNQTYDFLRKRYLIDSFYGNSYLNEHYHLNGGGNIRGFIKDKKTAVNSMLSTSNELSIYKSLNKFNASTEFKTFFDGGFFGDDFGLDTAQLLANVGLGACFSSTFLGQELTLRIDFPFITFSDRTLTIEKRNWIFSFQRSF